MVIIKISLLILGGIILWFILFTLMRCIDTTWSGKLKDQEVIDCEIETPQFKNGKVYKMYKQRGKFYKSDMRFIHSGLLTGHDVHFQSMGDFQKSLRRVF